MSHSSSTPPAAAASLIESGATRSDVGAVRTRMLGAGGTRKHSATEETATSMSRCFDSFATNENAQSRIKHARDPRTRDLGEEERKEVRMAQAFRTSLACVRNARLVL